MTHAEQKQIAADAIKAINDNRLLNIVIRLIYGVLKNNDTTAAEIIKKAVEGAKNGK